MMPIDSKKTKEKLPPYDPLSYAYRNRRDSECDPTNVKPCWNCGNVSRPSSHIGIMGLESRNAVLNQFNWVYLYII